ncbi:MAG: hypothetical protein CME26_04830 [Gemmatimonadetes bacterium]|nr:hypothetical protein [Gemmatimonadota bacterium]
MVRLGLIGCGGISQKAHLPGIEVLAEVVGVSAIADVVEENLLTVGACLDVGREDRYTDYREMLASGKVDAALIATPHNLHAEQAVETAEAGLTIIAEKPMGLTLKEADRIVEAVERNRVAYTICHNFLFTPGTRRALELLDDSFGARVYGRTKSLFSKSREQSDPETVWRSRASAGGGCISDTAYHEIYVLEAMMGSPIRYVEGRLRSGFLELDVDDLALLLFEHENGAVSTLSTSWGAAAVGPNETSNLCEVHGRERAIRVDRRGRGLYTREREAGDWVEVDIPEFADMDPLEQARSGHAGYFAAVFEAVATGRPLPTSIEDARRNLAIIEAARMANESRSTVDVTTLS